MSAAAAAVSSHDEGEEGEDVWEDEASEEQSKLDAEYNNTSSQIVHNGLEVDGAGSRDQPASSSSVRRLLVVSHLFGRSAEVIFQFILVIYLTTSILSDSLLLVSSYGLFSGLLVFFLGGQAGRFLDDGAADNRRLWSLQVVLLGQYGCVVACIVVCYILLDMYDINTTVPSDGLSLDLTTILLLVVIHLLGGFSLLFSEASTVAIEKDWVIVISGNDVNFLRALNVTLRQIDLGCKMMGPAAVGFSLMAVGEQLEPALVAVGIMNIVSFLAEYCCLTRICRAVPDLMVQRTNSDIVQDRDKESGQEVPDDQQRQCAKCSVLGGLFIYFQQDIAASAGGFGLSLLYLNVLSVGDLMTSYLIWRGLSLHLLGIWRGVASIIGLLGTAVYGWSSSRLSLESTSLLSIAFFLSCLTASFCSLFIPNVNVALSILVLGVTASRIGLWTFDLAINSLIQETVPESCRGIVGGTQHSLQALFFAIHFALGLIWSDPAQFHILCIFGYSAVVAAFFLVVAAFLFPRRINS